MNVKFTALALLLFALFSSTGFSQIIKIEKVNCKVSEADLETIKKIAKFEKDLYNNFFNTHNNDSLIISVSIQAPADYKEIQNKASGLHKTFGFYTAVLDQCFVMKRNEYLNTVIHEMSHCLLHHNLKNSPRWLHEGIAEFCGTMLIEDDKVSYAANSHRLRAVKEMVTKAPLKLQGIMTINNGEWGDLDKRSNLYSVSYAIIYFLIKKNPSVLKRMLLFMQEGQTAVDAIEYSYGGFYNFEQDFNAFYKNVLIKP